MYYNFPKKWVANVSFLWNPQSLEQRFVEKIIAKNNTWLIIRIRKAVNYLQWRRFY